VDDLAAEPAALMVLAYWAESGGTMMVRVTRTLDVRVGAEATSYARSRAEVLDEVVDWLDALVAPR
jgi:hypothetical protein